MSGVLLCLSLVGAAASIAFGIVRFVSALATYGERRAMAAFRADVLLAEARTRANRAACAWDRAGGR